MTQTALEIKHKNNTNPYSATSQFAPNDFNVVNVGKVVPFGCFVFKSLVPQTKIAGTVTYWKAE